MKEVYCAVKGPSWRNIYNTATDDRAKRRARRRFLYRLRQRVIELTALAVLVAIVAVPIWLLTRDGDKPAKQPAESAPPVSQPVKAEPPTYPVADAKTVGFADTVDAKYAMLWDVTAQRVVAARQPDTRVYPASVTKVMTLLVAVENITDFTDTFTMTFEIANTLYLEEATVAGYLVGEKATLEDMLYGCILPSGADACWGLAEYISGSEEAFVELMNQKAKELGLKNTHFVNTSGLHDDNHYTTAADMVVIMQAAMENDHCRQVLSTYQYTTAATPEHPEGILLTSTMFSRMYGDEPDGALIIAGKTGYTSEAKHTMVSYAQGEDGHDYIFVSLYGTNRWKATYDAINVYTDFCPSATTTATTTTTTAAP